jgi:hypothetical protein
MPSAMTERNMIVMDFNDPDPENRWSETFHQFNRTAGYFTTFEFNFDSIPVGNTNPFCFHLSWAEKSESRFWD